MSYNAEKMWDGPRPPFGAFRGHTGESYPSRWPHGFEPRMRGRGPLPFRGGAAAPGPPYTSQGANTFSYGDAGRGQERAWEETGPAPKEQMNIPRKGVPPTNFGDSADVSYSEQGLAPDMDYREREVLEPRKWTAPDVDYRGEEGAAHGYRVRLPLPSRQLITERENQEIEALELEHRKRLAASLDYRQREAADVEYKMQLEAITKRRERQELLLRERQYTERLMREREVLEQMRDREAVVLGQRDKGAGTQGVRDGEVGALGPRDGDSGALSLRDRDATALSYRERVIMERGLPAQVRESTDLDLRVKESEKGMDYLGRERGIEYQETLPREYSKGATLSMPYQANLSREYPESGTVSMLYREKEKSSMEYMEVEQGKDSVKAGSVKDATGFTSKDKDSSEMPYRQGETSRVNYEKREARVQRSELQKPTDADYREKECTDSDYRDKESSDADYRGRENAHLNYRNTKTADSDYRKRESIDADYRKSADDYAKESTDKMDTGREFLASSLKENSKGQTRLPTEYPLISTETAQKSGPKKVEMIPFLAFSEEELSSLSNMIAEAQSKTPAEVEAHCRSEPSCPGKMDTDFRGRPNPEAVNTGVKVRAEKATGYTAHSSLKELCSGDQDLRSKESFTKGSKKVEGDQDLRSSGHIQKDEDLRGGETKTTEEFFAQNSLLMDFLRLAAKELREKTTIIEGIEEPTALAPAIPDSSTAKTFHPDLIGRPARPLVSGSSIAPEIEFLCREDTDYRNMDFNDVDLRVSHRPDKRLAEKRSREDPLPGSKDKDYRRTPLSEGATKIIWLDGLPTGASREEILCALGSAHSLPADGVNLIGYIPGYSLGSVCVEFSLVEEAVGCMEANKGVLHFRGKKVILKYMPYSDRWSCLQCKAANVLSKERCWQCSALRAGSDHLSLRDPHKESKTSPTSSTPRSKKRKSKRSSSSRSPDRRKEKTSSRERSPEPKSSKGTKKADSDSATVIIRGINWNTSPDSVVKALQPYAQLSTSNLRIMKNRKSNHGGFGFIDLKNHKEAIRLTVLVRDLKPPLTIDGKPIFIDLAIGQRKNEQSKSQKSSKSSPSKNRKQKGQKKSYAHPGFRAEEGPSYIYDPKTGCYVDPLTDSCYNELKNEHKKDDYRRRDSERDKKEAPSRSRRGFTEENESEEEAFKRPLIPPPAAKKEEPTEPKVNPLLGLLGAYVEDSEDEEEQEHQDEEMLPPLQKKPALLPLPPAPKPVPKPVIKPIPKPPPKPEPKPAPTAPSSSDYDKLIDWKKMVCLLCRRQFPSKEALTKHKNLSDLHKQNIALHEKIKKSQKELEYLQQKEQEENQCIQRRLQQAKKELEMLEREEEGARQQEAGEGLDTDVRSSEKRKAMGADNSELSVDKKQMKATATQKPTGESYRENMKRLILERYKELE